MVTRKHIHCLVQAHPLLDGNLQWSHLSRIAVCIVRLCFVAKCSNRLTSCNPNVCNDLLGEDENTISEEPSDVTC